MLPDYVDGPTLANYIGGFFHRKIINIRTDLDAAIIIIIMIIIIIIYIALFSYSFIALYNDQVNVEPKS